MFNKTRFKIVAHGKAWCQQCGKTSMPGRWVPPVHTYNCYKQRTGGGRQRETGKNQSPSSFELSMNNYVNKIRISVFKLTGMQCATRTN
jgi:hypothetical protein